ncbi:hypothetical protein LSAT2_004752 [Lamellibrachia satsuma]|nr:hypothetical protein LSAT2_004752 [Lamellibrachia satsuma]
MSAKHNDRCLPAAHAPNGFVFTLAALQSMAVCRRHPCQLLRDDNVARRRTRFEPISTQTSVCCHRFVRGGVRLSSPRALPREDRRGDGVNIVLDRQEKGK